MVVGFEAGLAVVVVVAGFSVVEAGFRVVVAGFCVVVVAGLGVVVVVVGFGVVVVVVVGFLVVVVVGFGVVVVVVVVGLAFGFDSVLVASIGGLIDASILTPSYLTFWILTPLACFTAFGDFTRAKKRLNGEPKYK